LTLTQITENNQESLKIQNTLQEKLMEAETQIEVFEKLKLRGALDLPDQYGF
jgi:hypothetical protein